MSNIRFKNARILAMANGFDIQHGEVWVQGNRITHLGAPKPADIVWDREIDAGGNLLMPGFKNAHTHSGMTFLRSYADDLPLLDWLEKQVFPMEAKLTAEHVYHLSVLAIMEYLTSGVTCNFDMYTTPDTIAQASIDCGFRTVLVGGTNQYMHPLPLLEEMYNRYNGFHELISFQLGFHAEYTNTLETLEGIAALAEKYKAPVYTHCCETRAETDGCIARHGQTPPALFEKLGIWNYGGGGYHCVHVTGDDLDIFKRRGVCVVTNPGSNAKLASGIAPLTQMVEKGITVALGTDGPASNNCLDMFREMFLAAGLAKLRENDAAAMDAHLVLHMAVQGGAAAMRLPNCDCLAPGKLADIIMIDLAQPNMQPLNNPAKNIVYSGSKQNVKLTMVNGRILYEDGAFYINADPAEVYAKANEIITALKGS